MNILKSGINSIRDYNRNKFVNELPTEERDSFLFLEKKHGYQKAVKDYVLQHPAIVTPMTMIPPASIEAPFSAAKYAKDKFIMGTLDKIDKLAQGKFKYWGNWGGPSYSSGRYYDTNEMITKQDIQMNPPKDRLDALYLAHDLRYQQAATFYNQSQRHKALRTADEIFIKDAESLLKNYHDIDITQQLAAKASILAFKAKLKTDMGYDIEQIPNAKEAKQVAENYLNEYVHDEIENDRRLTNEDISKYMKESKLLQSNQMDDPFEQQSQKMNQFEQEYTYTPPSINLSQNEQEYSLSEPTPINIEKQIFKYEYQEPTTGLMLNNDDQ